MSQSAPHILVVEDDGDVREALAETLSDFGYRTTTAAHGKAALEILRSAPDRPVLVLLDIMMPVMDGWQFRAEQQGDPEIAGIPVVVITAVGDAQEKARAMSAAGALRKPVDLGELLATLRSLLAT